MQRRFPRAAREIAALSDEIGAATVIDSSRDEERRARDQVKETWKEQIVNLY